MTSLKIKHANDIMVKLAEDLGMYGEEIADMSTPKALKEFLAELPNRSSNNEELFGWWNEKKAQLESEGTDEDAREELQKLVKPSAALEEFKRKMASVKGTENLLTLWSDSEEDLEADEEFIEGTFVAAKDMLKSKLDEFDGERTAAVKGAMEKLASLSNTLDSKGFADIASVVDCALMNIIKK